MKNLLLITIVFLLSACGNYRDTKKVPPGIGGNSGLATSPDAPRKTTITFAQIKTEILDSQCINCHTGQHIAYENYAVVKASAFNMLERIQSADLSRQMPKGRPMLPQNLQAMFSEWVNAGAPEFGSQVANDTDPDPKPEARVSFADIKQEVLVPNNCVKCHSQYNNYGPVQAKLSSIISFVMSDRMPFPRRKGAPTVPVSKAGKELLLDWAGQGAPEFAFGPIAPVVKPVVKPNWISLRDNVIGPKCILCHNSYGSRAPTAMGTHSELRDWFSKSPKLFDFENPTKSHFIGAMLGRVDELNDEFFFDPMPFNSPADDVEMDLDSVTEENIEIIKKWIELKLPYNEEDL